MLIHITIGDVNFYHLIMFGYARFLHHKIIMFPICSWLLSVLELFPECHYLIPHQSFINPPIGCCQHLLITLKHYGHCQMDISHVHHAFYVYQLAFHYKKELIYLLFNYVSINYGFLLYLMGCNLLLLSEIWPVGSSSSWLLCSYQQNMFQVHPILFLAQPWNQSFSLNGSDSFQWRKVFRHQDMVSHSVHYQVNILLLRPLRRF